MNPEQLTQKFIELSEHQARYEAMCSADKEKMLLLIQELKEDIKTTKEDVKATRELTEDVHMLASSMQDMKEEQKELNKKVNALSAEEFLAYKENKKLIKNTIIGTISGGIGTGLLVFIIWFLTNFVKGGN